MRRRANEKKIKNEKIMRRLFVREVKLGLG
jgi:hypothetical protein